MARAAAATALVNKELDSLSKNSVQTQRATRQINSNVDGLGKTSARAEKDIDKLSGRLRILGEIGAALGPGLIPIGAVAIPAITGLASSLGFAAVGAGVLVTAFQGVGEALTAVDKAALDPTTKNLEAAQEALDALSPAAEQFAVQLRELLPALNDVQELAAEGILPGLGDGLEGALTALPRVQRIVVGFSEALGSIGENLGDAIAEGRLDGFLDFVADEGPKALEEFGVIIGQTGLGLANLWMAFSPLNNDFSDFLVETTADFERWSATLSSTAGFQEFIDYIRDTGPQVAATLGAIGNALVQIVQAAAPLAGPILQVVETLFNALASLADSDLGTPIFGLVAAMGALNIAVRTYQGISKTAFGGPAAAALRNHASGLNLVATAQERASLSSAQFAAVQAKSRKELRGYAGQAAGLGFVLSGAAEATGTANTASLALLGSIAGGPGALAGGLIGAFLDAKAAGKEFGDSMKAADAAIETGDIDAMTEALSRLRAEREDIRDTSGIGDFFADIGRQIKANPFVFGDNASDQNEAKQRQLELNRELERTGDIAEATGGFAKSGFEATAEGIDTATQSAKELQAELEEINAILDGRATFRSYQKALDDFAAIAVRRAELIKELADANTRATGGSDLTAAEQNRLSKINDRVKGADTPAERKRALADLRAFEATQAEQTSAERERAREDIARIRKELEAYKATLDVTTEAGQRNQAAIDAIAREAVAFAQTLSRTDSVAFLDKVRDQYVNATVAAGGARKAAEEFADSIGLIDGITGEVKITVDANGAVEVIDKVADRLRNLSRKWLAEALAGHLPAAALGEGGRDGNPDTPYWAGGYTGDGGKFEPKGVVHGGEFVFSKEATSGNVALLNEMHRRMRGYANGGLVGSTTSHVSNQYFGGPSMDYGQLAQAMAALRAPQPLYGDVHVHGDGSFRRALEQDQQLAGMDGIQR